MITVGLRNAFNENLSGEPEADANTALTELDKGLLNTCCKKCSPALRFKSLLTKTFILCRFEISEDW